MTYQVILPSGRGVRYRELTATEHDKILEAAAVGVGPEGTNARLKLLEQRYCIEAMVTEYTAEKFPPTPCAACGATGFGPGKNGDRLACATCKGLRVIDKDLDDKTIQWLRWDDPTKFDAIFANRDASFLSGEHHRLHNLSFEEVLRIRGKVSVVGAPKTTTT